MLRKELNRYERIWEMYGNGNENFPDFLKSLCDSNIISVKKWDKLTKLFTNKQK